MMMKLCSRLAAINNRAGIDRRHSQKRTVPMVPLFGSALCSCHLCLGVDTSQTVHHISSEMAYGHTHTNMCYTKHRHHALRQRENTTDHQCNAVSCPLEYVVNFGKLRRGRWPWRRGRGRGHSRDSVAYSEPARVE